jgi:hypothetical protein
MTDEATDGGQAPARLAADATPGALRRPECSARVT